MGASLPGGQALTTGDFLAVGGQFQQTATETQVQTVVRDAGNFHSLFVRCTAFTASTSITFSKNTAAGHNTVTISGTGTFNDTINYDVTVAGDKVDWKIGGTAPATITILYCLFDSIPLFSTRGNSICHTAGGNTWATGSAFHCINGQLQTNASNEGGVQTKIQKPGTMKFLQIILGANAKTSTFTHISRKNTANGALTMTVATGAGISEDTTNVDAIVANDLWNSSSVVGTDTTNNATYTLIAQDFVTSLGNIHQVQSAAEADVVGSTTVTQFVPVTGQFAFAATEANVQTKALAPFTFTNMCATLTIANSPASTAKFRKNTANGAQTFAIGTGTGQYQDTTNVDIVISTDLIDYSFAASATTAGDYSKCSCYGAYPIGVSRAFGPSSNAPPNLLGSISIQSPIFG